MDDQLEDVVLVEIASLRDHEEVIPDNLETRTSKLLRKGFYKPIIVDRGSMVILDGHHKWTAAKSLGLARVPVIMVDYLVDEGVLVDVWPDCGKESITKTEFWRWASQVMCSPLRPVVTPCRSRYPRLEYHSVN